MEKICLRDGIERCWRGGADCCDVRRVFSRSGNLEKTWRLRSEWGDYEGAKDAMVAKAMCQARLDTVNVETAAEATLLQREAAPLTRNYCVVT